MTNDNLIEFKRANARFRRELKMSKAASIDHFTEEIKPTTPIGKVWNNIRRFCGLNRSKGVHCIAEAASEANIVDRADIPDEFGKYWSSGSSDNNFPTEFVDKKNMTDIFIDYTPSNSAVRIETPIYLCELESALVTLRGKTPGEDRVRYVMIQNMPFDVKTRLLNLYNNIFWSFIPQAYKRSLIVPILKPQCDKTLLGSYRPISLNSCFAKLLDKIIANRLVWFTDTNKLICSRQIGFKRESLENVSKLRILGVFFNTQYSWDAHINYLQSSLRARVDLVKCLSSTRFRTNICTVVSVIRSLIISKIEYGIFLYGYANKKMLGKIKTQYNSAIRATLNAFRTTPIENLLFETNLPSLEDIREHCVKRLFRNIVFSEGTANFDLIQKNFSRSRDARIVSCNKRIIVNLKRNGLPISVKKLCTYRAPPWTIRNKVIDDLCKYDKNTTPKEVFCSLFRDIQGKFEDFDFIYTDGSKCSESVSFAVTTENCVIFNALLPSEFSSIYTAEIIAIMEAIKFVGKGKRAIICTDSLSAIRAITNPNNNDYYPSFIRSSLINVHPRVKIMWVPGHCGIVGNEYADKVAKNCLFAPVHIIENCNKRDINRFLKKDLNEELMKRIDTTSNWYKTINTNCYTIHNYLNHEVFKDLRKLHIMPATHLDKL
ncbi:uncharacterized protein LOC142230980 [Haematobia irritans]|uniref:uncharacterized protein LOC142230980 n=1 Tax=Haematobia irritans TaxID=7368 RepID=UPI003F5043D4